MADVTLVIDPDDTSFALHDNANGRRLLGYEAPVPETDSQWAFSADTEGERRANLRYQNRIITAQVLLERSSAALLEALENTLGKKIGKLAREGGELRFGFPSGTTITFNVLEATFNRSFDIADVARFRARYEISFVCEPFGLGAEEDLGDNTETTLPVLVFTEATIKGDVPALGRLVIDNDVASNQWWLTWGIQSRYYSSASSAALFWEAENLTDFGSTSNVAGPSGASGAGSNVKRCTILNHEYVTIMSTRAAGGGAHMSHIGTFRVYVRVQVPTTNAGTVSIALEWSDGDFGRWTRNTPVAIDPLLEGQWLLLDMGLVSLSQVTSGTQQWQGLIIGRSSEDADDIDIDYMMLVPVGEGSGVVSGVYSTTAVTPTDFSAYDNFRSTTAGNNLNGRVGNGGTWATSGDATDFQFSDSPEQVSRTTATGSSSQRYAVFGSALSNVSVQGTVSITGNPNTGESTSSGVIARWTDSSNYLRAAIQKTVPNAGVYEWNFYLQILVAGVTTTLGVESDLGLTDAARYTIKVLVFADGHVIATLRPEDGAVTRTITGSHSALATGGALDDGTHGFWDFTITTPASTRTYDDIFVTALTPDAAIYASQSLEIRSDRVRREDSAGTLWVAPSDYRGDYLLVPPSGAEARTTRVLVKGSRGDPSENDSSIDDISARLFVTPRYLIVPAA